MCAIIHSVRTFPLIPVTRLVLASTWPGTRVLTSRALRGDDYTQGSNVSLRQRARARELVGVPFVTTAKGLCNVQGCRYNGGRQEPHTLRFQTSESRVVLRGIAPALSIQNLVYALFIFRQLGIFRALIAPIGRKRGVIPPHLIPSFFCLVLFCFKHIKQSFPPLFIFNTYSS